ncbi:hypothetical protein V3C99_018165 [Haemonchus contortus]|uniref:DUF1758 domain-containing protein n=1 Tax=Haemonchus contortus TaxID=6289 RepID=A0A7I4Z5Z2_HAECO
MKKNISKPANSSTALTPSSKNRGKPRQKTQPASAINNQGDHDQGATVLHNEETVKPITGLQPREGNSETFLPIGELTAMDPVTRKLRKIAVLLDSGAEFSFIDYELAQELHLPTLRMTNLRLRTFGSDRVQECMSRKVPLEIWDSNGKPHSSELLTGECLTSTLRTPPILEEDIAFLKSLECPFTFGRKQTTMKPLILVSCDQLWQLLREDRTQMRLPSGLHLLPTHLRHLLTGQIQEIHRITQVMEKIENREDDLDQKWERVGTLVAGNSCKRVLDGETYGRNGRKGLVGKVLVLTAGRRRRIYQGEK